MALRIVEGDIFLANVEALVNPVNTVGVMGRGLALEFRRRYPANYVAYREACLRQEVVIGRMFVWRTAVERPRFIINFPTKRHWRDWSRLEYISEGLEGLKTAVREYGICSVALPELGCGNGRLQWQDVCPLIVEACAEMTAVEVVLYRFREPR